jgi:hypothetical protein
MIKTFIKHHVADYALTYALNNAIINLTCPEIKKMNINDIAKYNIIEKWKHMINLASIDDVESLKNITRILENQIIMNQIGNINPPNTPTQIHPRIYQ